MSYSENFDVENGYVSFYAPSKTYQWKPSKDITAYELALCAPAFLSGVYASDYVENLPDNAKRHFQDTTPAQPAVGL